MGKLMPLTSCRDCKHMYKGYTWKCERGEIYLVVSWTCSYQLRSIKYREILANEIIEADFNKQKFEEDSFIYSIPEWCPLEDDYIKENIMKENKQVKIKAKVVFEWVYKTNPKNYTSKELPLEEVTIDDMIRIDRDGFENDPQLFLDCCENIPILELVEVKSEDE